MRSFQFVTIDVYSARAFGGNPIMALPRADGSSDREMQSLAAGLNLSETTFVLPPADSARMFSPLAGTFEDAATGSAATALAALLLSLSGDADRRFEVLQGTEMGRPSQLACAARRMVDGVRPSVSGSCVQMFRGEVALPKPGEEPDCVA